MTSRRRFLAVLGTGVGIELAGCTGLGPGESPNAAGGGGDPAGCAFGSTTTFAAKKPAFSFLFDYPEDWVRGSAIEMDSSRLVRLHAPSDDSDVSHLVEVAESDPEEPERARYRPAAELSAYDSDGDGTFETEWATHDPIQYGGVETPVVSRTLDQSNEYGTEFVYTWRVGIAAAGGLIRTAEINVVTEGPDDAGACLDASRALGENTLESLTPRES